MTPSHLTQESLTFMLIILFACLLISAFLQPWKLLVWRIWAVSLVLTSGGLAAMVYSLRVASSPENLATARGEVTRSKADTERILAGRLGVPGQCVIPTGVQVQGFKFETSLDLAMHGYLWQTYPRDCIARLRGYTVPEAGDGGFNRREIRRIQNANGSETVLYQFQTTQRQLFNYEHYPFDYQTLWLRLWSLDFDGGAVLVPDFDSYPKWVDELKLGIDPDAEIGGFALDFTRWSIFFPPTQTSFGLETYDGPPNRVGLYYNVGFHRLLTGPFVNHIVPIMAIILLTFAAMLFVHTDEDRATAVLTFIGALFFTAIFNHQGIRSSISAAGFTVVGLYSIISYVLLVLVALNVILVAKTDIRWFEWNDNIFSKALFMPLTAWMLAWVTHYALLGQ
jgi:hypothetical protein